ncbi:MAG: response regulator [Desulfatitalea sp.]|nr:response regulator [Desulfatitalea sp.]NNJ98875.1 response regulator [Desulfatitalea sp.]
MSYKILTVDDSRTIRMIIKNAFKNYQCELHEAENGRDGLALAAEIKPDLIILDITMPVMTGIEMLAKILEDETLKDTAVIMLTAESGRDNVMNIVKMGVKDYIVKPFKGDQLIDRVKLVLVDLKERIDAPVSKEGESEDTFFTVDNDIVVLTLPTKINRNKATEIDEQLQTKVNQMSGAGANKFILDLSGIENLSMTAMQAVLAMVNQCLRAKFELQLVATPDQAKSLMGFKETSEIAIKLSLEEAKAKWK